MSPLYVFLVGAVVASVAAAPSLVHDQSSAKTNVIRVKTGEPVEQDPFDPKYYALAIESVMKYNDKHIGGVIKGTAVGILDVTTQVVTGRLTHLMFYVDDNRNVRYGCDSTVWERLWLPNEKDRKIITVDCQLWVQKTN